MFVAQEPAFESRSGGKCSTPNGRPEIVAMTRAIDKETQYLHRMIPDMRRNR
jgi:hypothetical protein